MSELWSSGETAKLDAKLLKRVLVRLDALEAAARPEDMDIPGFDFHALRGFKPTRYTVHVNGPWCITFEFEGADAVSVDFEQYHQETAMAAFSAKRHIDRPPTHPGFLLADTVIPATGRSKTEIAALLGISRQQLHDILNERKPVSPAVAVRLGKLFGNGPGLWLRMQANYDAWRAAQEIDVSGIPTIAAA